jgi:dipeptidase
VVVGKNASADGSVMFAHNEDAVAPAVNGKHWVAQRVPDDKVAPIPNCYTIQGIDLRDTVNFLGSPDIIEYAITRGWYDPARSLD